MKTPSNDLFLLIKTLSKTEKRYFKLYVKNNSFHDDRLYIQLFDAIYEQKEYNEALLKPINGPLSRNFKLMKWRLLNLVLKCLDNYYSESIFDSVFKNKFKNIYVLYQKGLYNKCIQCIDSLMKQAQLYERYPEIIELCRFQKRGPLKRTGKVDGIYAIESKAIDALAEEKDLQYLSDKIYETKGQAIATMKKEVKLAFKHPLLNTEIIPGSFRSRYFYYNAIALCYSGLGNEEECYKYGKSQVKLFESNSHQIIQYPELYIPAVHNFMISCFETGRMKEYYRYMKEIKKREDQFNLMENKRMAAALFGVISNHETAAMGYLGNFRQINLLIPELEEKLKHYANGINIHIRLTLYYNIAYNFFGAENYQKALLWANRIINHPRVDARQDIQLFARILCLIVHYETGKTELLDYSIRSSFRFMRKKDRLYKLTSHILTFINKVYHIPKGDFRMELFKSFKKDLLVLSKDPMESAAFKEFDFISWLDSKIENRSFAECVRQRSTSWAKAKV